MTVDTKSRAAAMVITAIVETIEESKDGAPLEPMYAALMGLISYNSFTSVIDALVKAGVIRVSNHVAYKVQQ